MYLKQLIEICLIYTSKIFTHDFPGIKILIPYYFDVIHHIFVISKKDFLYKRSYNEMTTSNLLRVSKMKDIKTYVDLLKNSCINIIKALYGIINKYSEFQVLFKEKFVKLIDYKKNIYEFVQCIIFEFDENLQIKLKSNTPTKKKKNEMIEDTLEFKNNFLSLALYVMKDLGDESIEVFKVKNKLL